MAHLSKIFSERAAPLLEGIAELHAKTYSKIQNSINSSGRYSLVDGVKLDELEADYRKVYFSQFKTDEAAFEFFKTPNNLTGLAKEVFEDARKLNKAILTVDKEAKSFKTCEKMDIAIFKQELALQSQGEDSDSILLVEDLGDRANICFAMNKDLTTAEHNNIPLLGIIKNILAGLSERFSPHQLEFFLYLPGQAVGRSEAELFGQLAANRAANGEIIVRLQDKFATLPQSIAEITFEEFTKRSARTEYILTKAYRQFQLNLV